MKLKNLNDIIKRPILKNLSGRQASWGSVFLAVFSIAFLFLIGFLGEKFLVFKTINGFIDIAIIILFPILLLFGAYRGLITPKDLVAKLGGIICLAIILFVVIAMIKPCWFFDFKGIIYCHNGGLYMS